MRARIANSGMDFWAVLAAAALATLMLVAATQLQAQTHPISHNSSQQDGAMPAPSAGMHGSGRLSAARGRAGASARLCVTPVIDSETTGDGALLKIVPD